jgi:hypothetical protein
LNAKIVLLALTLCAVAPVVAQDKVAQPDSSCPVEFKSPYHHPNKPYGTHLLNIA